MDVQVHYQVFNQFTGQCTGYEHVATVSSDRTDVLDALEDAFAKTQNICGAWSMEETFEDGEPNPDFSSKVQVEAPLRKIDGRAYGHRSSMTGDRFVVAEETYVCDMVGFSLLEGE